MPKWWLISDNDVQRIRKVLEQSGHEAVMYILDTGLHETDAIPADFMGEVADAASRTIHIRSPRVIRKEKEPMPEHCPTCDDAIMLGIMRAYAVNGVATIEVASHVCEDLEHCACQMHQEEVADAEAVGS